MNIHTCIHTYMHMHTYIHICIHPHNSRQCEVIRDKVPEDSQVMLFGMYLEVITILEEHHSGFKDIHMHKLFYRMKRFKYSQAYIKPPVDLSTIVSTPPSSSSSYYCAITTIIVVHMKFGRLGLTYMSTHSMHRMVASI